MMKILFHRILPGVLLAGFLATTASAQSRIATVDLQKIFNKYWKREQAEAALKERGAEMDKDYKALMEDYSKTKDDYTKLLAEANDQTVTPDERDKRKTRAEAKLLEVQTAEKTVQTFAGNAREQIDSQKKRMRDTILQEIRTAINAKAKAQSFSLVLDASGETGLGTNFILYTNGENDLTDDILKQLNAAAPPAATPAASGADDTAKPAKKK